MRIPGRVLAELAATTRFGDIRLLDEVDSTNRYVRDAAAAGASEGLVVAADHQHAGRGRLGRSWDAPAGSGLLVSLLLRPTDLPAGRLHLTTAAVGLAARAALGSSGVDAGLKWPNDLLVGERKLAGILAEAVGALPGHPPPAVVVGIGINVHAAPPGAVGADEIAGVRIGRAALLVALLLELEARLGRWDAVASEYRRSCVTVGRRVRVEAVAGPALTGTAVRVDDDGRLVVVADDGSATEVALSAGDVVHVRPAPTSA
jgi:BirA family biotin operon repressor/biotin-[acetyl-CoA-carboxylase] ligase